MRITGARLCRPGRGYGPLRRRLPRPERTGPRPFTPGVKDRKMSGGKAATVRAVALSGPCGAGKTSLLESMLHAADRIQRKGSVPQGSSVGDASEEARARGLSTELNVAGFDYLGDRFVVLDCPGSVDFASEADTVLPAVDLTVVVADPDPDRASLLHPLLRRLDEFQAPHGIFIH